MSSTESLTCVECTVCGTQVARNGDLSRHMKLHAQNKEQFVHRCPWADCDFSSLQKSNVDSHYNTHTDRKPNACPDCDFCTNDPGSLTRHRKRRHGYIPKPRRARAGKAEKPSVSSTARHNPYARPSTMAFRESKYTAMASAAVPENDSQQYFWSTHDSKPVLSSPTPRSMEPAVDTGRHMQLERGSFACEGFEASIIPLSQDGVFDWDFQLEGANLDNWDFTTSLDTIPHMEMGQFVVDPELAQLNADIDALCMQLVQQQQVEPVFPESCPPTTVAPMDTVYMASPESYSSFSSYSQALPSLLSLGSCSPYSLSLPSYIDSYSPVSPLEQWHL